MLVMRALSHAYPFRPVVKTAVDQTSTRSTTTKPLTIKPPPLPAINGVAGSGSLLHREPIQSIRQATATEDALAAEQAAVEDTTSTVRAFTRRKPVRKPFPEHLPRERVVIAAPTSCACCGSDRIVKMGEVEEGHKTVRGTVLPTTHRDARGHPAPVEGDPAPENQDWAREVHLPGLREDQPAARSIPHHSPWLGRSATDCDGGV